MEHLYTESYLFKKKKIMDDVMVRLFLNLFHVVPHFEGGPSSILLFLSLYDDGPSWNAMPATTT